MQILDAAVEEKRWPLLRLAFRPLFLLGSLFAVQKGDVLSLYAFGSPEGGKMPRELWTGTIQQFGDGIMFCGVEDDGLLEIV